MWQLEGANPSKNQVRVGKKTKEQLKNYETGVLIKSLIKKAKKRKVSKTPNKQQDNPSYKYLSKTYFFLNQVVFVYHITTSCLLGFKLFRWL